MKNQEKRNIRPKNIIFAARLEHEKGADIVLSIIRESIRRDYPHVYHIYGDGSYFSDFSYFSEIGENRVKIYGKVPHNIIQKSLQDADLSLMPSRFLETFGLSALESLEAGVPVIGIRKGGLVEFIPESLALDENTPEESFFACLDALDTASHVSISHLDLYSADHWRAHLETEFLTSKNILIIHDYHSMLGGAEQIVARTIRELRQNGKNVSIFAPCGATRSMIRTLIFFLSPLFFWRYFQIRHILRSNQIDSVFSHTIFRSIGFWGILAIRHACVPHTIMHHDIGLITPYPSRIEHESEIPERLSLSEWTRGAHSIVAKLACIYKLIIVTSIWRTFPVGTRHLVPSAWMMAHYAHVTRDPIEVFSHAYFPDALTDTIVDEIRDR